MDIVLFEEVSKLEGQGWQLSVAETLQDVDKRPTAKGLALKRLLLNSFDVMVTISDKNEIVVIRRHQVLPEAREVRSKVQSLDFPFFVGFGVLYRHLNLPDAYFIHSEDPLTGEDLQALTEVPMVQGATWYEGLNRLPYPERTMVLLAAKPLCSDERLKNAIIEYTNLDLALGSWPR